MIISTPCRMTNQKVWIALMDLDETHEQHHFICAWVPQQTQHWIDSKSMWQRLQPWELLWKETQKTSFTSLIRQRKLIWTCYIPSTVINLKISTARAVAEEGLAGAADQKVLQNILEDGLQKADFQILCLQSISFWHKIRYFRPTIRSESHYCHSAPSTLEHTYGMKLEKYLAKKKAPEFFYVLSRHA